MPAEENLAKHHQPEVERRLVGIVLSLIGEYQHVSLLDGLIHDAYVPQFVGRRIVPQGHDRGEGEQHQEYDGQYGVFVNQLLDHVFCRISGLS